MYKNWMSLDSLLLFLKWYEKFGPPNISDIARNLYKAIRKDKKSKRAYSQANRWDIAYEQRYLCGHCKVLLHPSFEIDHVIELCDGGEDIRKNCVALCRTCHGIKTRKSRQKRIRDTPEPINERSDNNFSSYFYTPGRKNNSDKKSM